MLTIVVRMSTCYLMCTHKTGSTPEEIAGKKNP